MDIDNVKKSVKKDIKKGTKVVKEKTKEVSKEISTKIEEKINNKGKVKPIITSRILFISVLDKIYLIILGIMFVVLTYNNFEGQVTSASYHLFNRIGSEIVILILLFITYLIMNWFYKCSVKTVLCLTEKQVYKETYYPFIKRETSIPLENITRITTLNILWIFRSVWIFQYHRLPIVFHTWNNKEFKDEATKLLINKEEKVENVYETKNILNENQYKYIVYIGFVLGVIICLLGVVKAFSLVFSSESRIAGTYNSDNYSIVLNRNGNCDISEYITEDINKCTWHYNSDNKSVILEYEYDSTNYYYGTYTNSKEIKFEYNKKNKTLTNYNTIFKKN